MFSNDIAYEIIAQNQKELFISIDLLNWKEEWIESIEGIVSSGSMSIQGDSTVRRTCSLTMTVTKGFENITSAQNKISLNKKIRVRIGLSNEINKYKKLGDIIWFDLGLLVLTGATLNRNLDSTILTLSAQDKMCLLNGTVAGEIDGFLEVHQSTEVQSDGTEVLKKLTISEIIYYIVAGLGGESRHKIIISDVAEYVKTPMIYEGENTLYFDSNGNYATSSNYFRKIEKGDYAGYILEPFYYPGELVKSPGETISSILDDLVSVLGNYEYFYDVDGNFIFQEIKNYLNTSFTPIDKLSNIDYIANFDKTPYVFSFKDKPIVTAYSNSPSWLNIKNDFIVWGTADETGGPVMYHLAVDDKPNIENYNKPWQQYLIEYGQLNPKDPGVYYGELSTKFPQIYDAETNEWKMNPNAFKYYFDMIDTKSAFGEFSVGAIGKRTKAITDDKVGRLYPPVVPDYVLLNAGGDAEENQQLINQLNAKGQKFFNLKEVDYRNHTQAPYSKDAFSVVREQLYLHSTFNESISISSLPLYFLDANQRIEIYDEESNIFGDYMIKSLSIPLNSEGLMSITAIKAQQRI